MKNSAVFSLENILMSLAGHLVILCLLIIAASVIAPKSKLVSPDRVQIIEMDLRNVKITRDETLVYNTKQAAEKKPKTEIKKTETKKTESKNDTRIGDDAPKKTSGADRADNKAAPKTNEGIESTTTVRVNRETTTLNRTMTVSVIDAFRIAMTRCWVFDANRPNLENIRAVAHLTMAESGMVRDLWFEEESRAATDSDFGYILETIRMAVDVCQPFSMLPRSEYDMWKEVQLTFYPATGAVQ